jgi:cytochrome P450
METDNEKAQILRKLLNPILAKPTVDGMDKLIYQKVRQFSDQTAQKLEKKESINMRPLFQALSVSKILHTTKHYCDSPQWSNLTLLNYLDRYHLCLLFWV